MFSLSLFFKISVQISCIFTVGSGWKPAAFDLIKPEVVTGTVLFLFWNAVKRIPEFCCTAKNCFNMEPSFFVLIFVCVYDHSSQLTCWEVF